MRPAARRCPVSAMAHPDVLAAMHAQLDRLAYAHTSFFTSQAAEELADDLVAHAPPGIGHVFYVSGGSEAVEAALKLARQYFVERGEPQRRYVIARRQSYHGITLGALAVGGRATAAQAIRAAADRDASRVAGLRISRSPRRRDAGGVRRSGWPRNSRPRSTSSAARTSSLSSPRPWSARRSARCRPCPAISSACARSATATACCSSSTR